MWERDMPRFIRLVFFLLLLYAILCAVIGVFVAEGALHPQRRAITPKSEASVRQIALDKQSEFQDVSIPAVAQTKVPVLLIHGQIDSNIPVRHSRQIHSRNPATVLWEVPNADHCGAISTAPREFETRIVDWFQSRRP
jgi:pimeloyl-ACP methyl ester carboxylesterase